MKRKPQSPPGLKPKDQKSTPNKAAKDQLLLQGIGFQRKGDFKNALKVYENILSVDPDHFDAIQLIGGIYLQQKQFELALSYFDQALKIKTNSFTLFNNHGLTLKALNKYSEALSSFQQSIQLNPNFADSQSNLGNTLVALNQIDQALTHYEKAIELEPNHPDAHFNLGVALEKQENYEDALRSYDTAIILNSKDAHAHQNRGAVLGKLKRYELALDSYRQALALNPNLDSIFFNQGILLEEMGQAQEALVSYEKTVEINPQHAVALYNLGNLLKKSNRLEEAIVRFDQVIATNAEKVLADSHWNKSLALLTIGKFKEGWIGYEWREIANKGNYSHFLNKPKERLWLGECSLKDKNILIYFEQGYGDTLQFCRYITLLKNMGAKVIFEVQKPLLSLLHSLDGVSELIPENHKAPHYDYHCPLISLPLAFKTDLDNLPAPPHYLSSDPEKLKQWQARLGENKKIKIGIAWSSTSSFKYDQFRSLELTQFIKALPSNDRFEFHCLQKEIKKIDKATLEDHPEIHFHGKELHDFSDTAALIDSLDLVISTCTSIPHLSGALGKPTWVLLSHEPDWRWLLNRDDSPWYPRTQLFRQPTKGDWGPVLDAIKTELLKLA
jgi:tetratricopeptide (TPR) repeat protein